MRRKGVFHFVGARLEGCQKVAVAALKIFKNVGQLVGCHLGIEHHDPFNNVVCPDPVSWVEIAWFDGGLERADNHPRRIGAQMESLPVQECNL
jgi:hypothetical protein